VPYAKSIVDYIFRWLASKFLPKEEQAQAGVHVSDGPPPAGHLSLVPKQSEPMNDFKSMYALDDAPTCANCGSIMVRNGSCYKCINCGETSGCS
jgi:ribonucleoside-diphosphate reductase alpha chain